MKNNKFLFSLICCLLLSVSWFGLARSYDDIIKSGYVKIAVYSDFAPYSYIDDSVAKGIDIQVAKLIAAKLGVKLQLKWTPADENLADDMRNNLWKGHFFDRTLSDIMLRVPYDKQYATMKNDIGEPEHEHVHMFGPYHKEQWQIIFDKQQINDVPNMAIFQYHSIGVEIDSVPHFYLTTAFNGRMREKTKHFNSIQQAIKSLKNKQVSAVMGLKNQLYFYNGGNSKNNIHYANNSFAFLNKTQWDIGMAIKNDYRQLSYELSDIIYEAMNNGTLENIFAQYNIPFSRPDYYSPSN